MWRCASIKPGITVLPPALIVRPPPAAGAVAETDTILPSRTTTAPRSITRPVPSRIRAFVMVRFCALAPTARNKTTAVTPLTRVNVLIVNGLPNGHQV